MREKSVKASFAAAIHKYVLPEIDRVFNELVSECIENWQSNPREEIKKSIEWLKPVLTKYVEDQLMHCCGELKDQQVEQEESRKE